MSNNTISYTIYKDGVSVGSHTQNVMCRRCNDSLMKFQPAKDYTIIREGYEDHYDGYYDDEDEDGYYEYQEPVEYRLDEWLVKNPGELTHNRFVAGETVKLTKRRGMGKVVEALKGKWFPEYLVDIDGVVLLVSQIDIMP